MFHLQAVFDCVTGTQNSLSRVSARSQTPSVVSEAQGVFEGRIVHIIHDVFLIAHMPRRVG